MDYFSKFLRSSNQPQPQIPTDRFQEFHDSWDAIKTTLLHPDERQLARGIKSTNVPAHLKSFVDSLVWESTRTEEGSTGVCLEYLLKNDVLGTLVRLSEVDRPSGIQAEVLRAVQNMVVLMDEQFLVHSAVHKAVLRLLRNCAGDDLQEQLDGRKVMGAASSAVRGQSSEYEEDLVNLLCILCSRIRTYRQLLMIFFHDKHWYHSEPLFSVEEEEEEEEEEDNEEVPFNVQEISEQCRNISPTPSQTTITSVPTQPVSKKVEYEFLLFNYLLRFVHREGHIGDFARAGLLFLMDVAMSPEEIHSEVNTPLSSDPSPSDPIRDAELALAEYILDGDFSEVLAAGLGAVYSLLPSKLMFHPITTSVISENGMTIGNTGPDTAEEREKQELSKEKSRAMGIEDALDIDFRQRLDHFLKLLEFLQDVLRRNVTFNTTEPSFLVGAAIAQSIIDAVRRIFLENVLYPSILECSDTDGSAIAVMSYIEVMIRTVRNGPLADLLVSFLLSEDNDEVRLRHRPFSMLALDLSQTKYTAAPDKRNKSRRRKSSAMALLELEAPASRKQSQYFTSMGRFTLRDLLLANLRSNSQATATSALQLLQSMLLQYPQLSANRLLLVIADPVATSFPHPAMVSDLPSQGTSTSFQTDNNHEIFRYPGALDNEFSTETIQTNESSIFLQPKTTYSTHEREMGLYLTLISRVDPSHNGDAFSTGYDHYLSDALFSIQNQLAYQLIDDDTNDPDLRQKQKHRLNVNDPILSLILESLRRFFSNTPQLNMALTGVLATLATHPDRSLAGWLMLSSNDVHRPEESNLEESTNDDGDDRSVDFEIETRLANDMNFLPASSIDEMSRPVIHTIFHGLVTQLERYRTMVDNFDKFLLERRQGLLFSENMTDALTFSLDFVNPPNHINLESDHQSRQKQKPSTTNSLVSFLTPKKGKVVKSSVLPEPTTPTKKSKNTTTVASPFGRHYKDTGSIIVEPFAAPIPASSPWTPGKITKWNTGEEDVFTSSGWNKDTRQPDEDEEVEIKSKNPANVTLSQILDNVVILEESIKELVAIIHARRSLGIDSIRYL